MLALQYGVILTTPFISMPMEAVASSLKNLD
jgi:hypothetical protein